MRQLFNVGRESDQLGNAAPRPAIWPKYEGPVVRRDEHGVRELLDMSWGFRTQKISEISGKPIQPEIWNNARDDKMQARSIWRESFRARRCLVPATSFREAKGRSPAIDYWFALKGEESRPLFAFAGLWRKTHPSLAREGENLLAHTMVTTTANEIVCRAHPDRMPVILEPADFEVWLDGTPEEAIALLRPFPADKMRVVAKGEGILRDPIM